MTRLTSLLPMAAKPHAVGERRRGAYRVLETARAYDLWQRVVGVRGFERVLISRFLQPTPGMRVLDVGAGTGRLLDALDDCEYTALEPNSDYLDELNQRVATRDGRVIHGTTAALDRIDETFDRILLVGVLHHLDDRSAREAACSIANHLAPGGRLVTVDPCFHRNQGWIARTLAARDRGSNVRDPVAYRDLVDSFFESVSVSYSSGVLRVPLDHTWMVCERPLSEATREVVVGPALP